MHANGTYDVTVVGAGPAGSTLARAMARRGYRVLLLEKQRLPRYKTCAGGVTVRAANLLDFDIMPVVEQVVHSSRFSYKMAR
ncbi:MAG: FAD-dependent oxidoreductase, partial [Chloroflexi bacterium]|nr:FAD-dependent oxidoreductase [Chloroflexota bacterium]